MSSLEESKIVMDDEDFLSMKSSIPDEYLIQMASRLYSIRQTIEEKEKELKELKEQEANLSGVIIPEIFKEKGIPGFFLPNKIKISVDKKLEINIPSSSKLENVEKRNILFAWIEERFPSLIQKQIVKNDPTKEEVEKLQEIFGNVEVVKDVNTNSLKAVLNDKLGLKKNSLQTMNIEEVPKELSPFLRWFTVIE